MKNNLIKKKKKKKKNYLKIKKDKNKIEKMIMNINTIFIVRINRIYKKEEKERDTKNVETSTSNIQNTT